MISSSPQIIFPNEDLPSIIGAKDKVEIIVDPKNRVNGKINGYSILQNEPL
jgi:hypothetical protein